MNSHSSPWPRRLAGGYIAVVFAVWIIVILPGPFAAGAQNWIFVIGLPWSLLFVSGSALSGPLGLVLLFLTGILNASVLYLVAARWSRVRRDNLLQPPAA